MSQISNIFDNLLILIRPSSLIDIIIVAFVAYKIIRWIQFTQAAQVAKGILFLLVATQMSDWFELYTVNFLLRSIMTVGFIAIIIVFQPELRRVLEQIGRTSFWRSRFSVDNKETERTIGEIIEAIGEMSNTKTGALIILEKETGIDDIIMTGTRLDSIVSSELIQNIFTPNTPLQEAAFNLFSLIRITTAPS